MHLQRKRAAMNAHLVSRDKLRHWIVVYQSVVIEFVQLPALTGPNGSYGPLGGPVRRGGPFGRLSGRGSLVIFVAFCLFVVVFGCFLVV